MKKMDNTNNSLIMPVFTDEKQLVEWIKSIGGWWLSDNILDYWHPKMSLFYNNKRDAVVMWALREIWGEPYEGSMGIAYNLAFQDIDMEISLWEIEIEKEQEKND